MSQTKNHLVPKEDRRRQILQFLADTSAALPPKVVHINLKLRGSTFGLRTTKSLLYELRDEGLLDNPEIKTDYYRITDKGREYLDNPPNESN